MNAKKKALGRGLSALLENSGTNEISNYNNVSTIIAGSIANIPVDFIDSNPFQPRIHFDEEALRELASSIKEQGVIQPITVRQAENNRYQLISGERRLKASISIGLENIPAYVRTASDHSMLEMALVENIQRKDLNPIEVSLSFQRLIDECKLTQEELSDKVGKNRSTITNFLRLLKLPATIQIGLQENKISTGHARAIINVPSIDTQLAIYKDIIEQDLSVRQTEEIVRNIDNEPYSFKKSTKATATPSLPQKYLKVIEQLEKNVGLKTDIKRNNSGKGTIIFHFRSDNDLDYICSKFKK